MTKLQKFTVCVTNSAKFLTRKLPRGDAAAAGGPRHQYQPRTLRHRVSRLVHAQVFGNGEQKTASFVCHCAQLAVTLQPK